MKTTILSFALALAAMPLMFGRAQSPAHAGTSAAASKPSATAKKHHKTSMKKTAKPAAKTAAVPMK